MALFADHQDQWALLAEQPERAPQVVEEVMRFQSAVGVVPRMPREDLEIDGYRISPGTLVTLSLAGANHDPAVYDDPLTFDVRVDGREPQLGFGGGVHYCLGANLARAEMQEALVLLAHRWPTFTLDGEPEWRSALSAIWGPEKLPLRVL